MRSQQQNPDDNQSTVLLYKGIDLLIRFVLILVISVISFMLYDGFALQIKKNNQGIILSEADIADRMIEADKAENMIVDGIHMATGLVYTEDFDLIRGTCTSCHSAKLIIQNRATREGWIEMIRWMQKTQGLWELGSNEDIIVDYLAEYYAPKDLGRRPNLDIEAIQWYILDM